MSRARFLSMQSRGSLQQKIIGFITEVLPDIAILVAGQYLVMAQESTAILVKSLSPVSPIGYVRCFISRTGLLWVLYFY